MDIYRYDVKGVLKRQEITRKQACCYVCMQENTSKHMFSCIFSIYCLLLPQWIKVYPLLSHSHSLEVTFADFWCSKHRARTDLLSRKSSKSWHIFLPSFSRLTRLSNPAVLQKSLPCWDEARARRRGEREGREGGRGEEGGGKGGKGGGE